MFIVKLTIGSGDTYAQMEVTIDSGVITVAAYVPADYTVTYDVSQTAATIASTVIPIGTKVLVVSYEQGRMTSVSIHIWPVDTSMVVPVSQSEETRLFFRAENWVPILHSVTVS